MIKPKESVRRFDVFAEYSRQEAIRDGMKPDEAKGYAIWLAKVVAARRYGRSSSSTNTHTKDSSSKKHDATNLSHDHRWRTLDGVPQTDALFDKEIIERMGSSFYERVVVPAVKAALESGDTYVSIRDKIRQEWKPAERALSSR